jgi:methyl-accepting chemotaxis protein
MRSIGQKIIVFIIGVAVAALIIGLVILNWVADKSTTKTHIETKEELVLLAKNRINAMKEVGISNALALSSNADLKIALQDLDHELAYEIFSTVSGDYKDNTNYKNIKIHIHTSGLKSFLRVWDPEKNGDDLSKLRPSVVKVKETAKPVNGFEIGNDGLNLRSIFPIYGDVNQFNGKRDYLGSLEFIKSADSVAKLFDKSKDSFLLLMDANSVLKHKENEKKLNSYIVSQEFINKKFFDDAKHINMQKLFTQGYLVSNRYFYTYTKVTDFRNQEIGTVLLGRPLHIVNQAVDSAHELINISLVLILVIIFLIVLTIIILIKKVVTNPIKVFEDGLIDFLKYLNKESDTSSLIKLDTSDEIGKMAKVINENIEKININIDKDKAVIDEARTVMEKVNVGLYNSRIETKSNSNDINLLVDEINGMIENSLKNLTSLSDSLLELGNAKYDHNIPKIDGLTGILATLFSGAKVTQTTINDIIGLIDNASKRLSFSTADLTNSSVELTNSSNQQAAALEQTAAAIEEVTTIIRETSDAAINMSKYAKNVTESSKTGRNLADKTSSSMDELSQEVSTINDAITVIDQIAFQTNILSLNAAVEAATAGEAGKGFAVVAQEVRNLAARSAEAANEIKSLVESANSKALEGKKVASLMINGFNELNENIDTTMTLIDKVASSTGEQEKSMVQINDTINSLDQATQNNTNLAGNINSLAHTTKELTTQLQLVIDKTSFDDIAKRRVCDINKIFDFAKLKAYHIGFKNNYLAKAKVGENIKVETCTQCNLGKWIADNSNEEFTNTNEWKELNEVHKIVHDVVQEIVDLYEVKADNNLIIAKTAILEDNIEKIFNLLDMLRERNCDILFTKK